MCPILCLPLLRSCITTLLNGNTTYWIRAASTSYAPAQIKLAFGFFPSGAPLNDSCGTANPIFGPGVYTGDNILATTDGNSSCAGGGTKDVWWEATPPFSGNLVVHTCGSNFDTVLSVHEGGCPGTPGNEIACNVNCATAGAPCDGLPQSCMSVPVTGGTDYRIRVAGNNGETGSVVLEVDLEQPPCPEDVNGDGTIDVLDLIDLLLCFGQPATPGCEAEDVNGDGTVNVLDLIDLLLAFGTACP